MEEYDQNMRDINGLKGKNLSRKTMDFRWFLPSQIEVSCWKFPIFTRSEDGDTFWGLGVFSPNLEGDILWFGCKHVISDSMCDIKFIWYYYTYPLVNVYSLRHRKWPSRNTWFSHQKWWIFPLFFVTFTRPGVQSEIRNAYWCGQWWLT